MTEAREVPASSGGRIYFGWRVVAALFLCMLALFGVAIFSFIILTAPMAAEFGWSAAQSGMLVSAMYLVAPLALLAGPVTARIPPWRLIFTGLLVQAAAMALLGHVSDIGQLYALRVFMGFGKVMTASAAPIIVARWFSRRFATAVAFVWAGGSAGGFVMSPLTEALANALGWRDAALAIAGIVVLLTLAAGLLARGAASPAALGLGLDGDLLLPGDRQDRHREDSPRARHRVTIAPGVALLMVLAVITAGMTSLGTFAHQPTFLRAAGLSAEVAATVLGLTAAGSLIGSATIGLALDRFPGWCCGLFVAASVYIGLASLYLVLKTPSVPLAVIGAIFMGYAFGAGEVMWITFTKREFGEAAFPVTYGGFYFALQVGYALGGGVAGWGLERFGSLGFLAMLAFFYAPPLLVSLFIRAARMPVAARDGSVRIGS